MKEDTTPDNLQTIAGDEQSNQKLEASTEPELPPAACLLPPSPAVFGLEPGTVAIASYSDEWAMLFEQEKQRLQSAIGQHIVAIAHVGSTSVPGLAAKPIIDIAVALVDLRYVDDCIEPLGKLDYNYKGEYGLVGRHYFNKGNPRTHHLHMVERTSDYWRNHLLFRDYLRRHPEVVAEYASLKRSLAAQFKSDTERYTDSKAPFITRVLEAARRELSSLADDADRDVS